MAIYFPSNDPEGLLRAFDEAIDTKKIHTWRRLVLQRKVYTHVAKQWVNKAFLLPHIRGGELLFLVTDDKPQTREVYDFYCNHLVQEFEVHFRNMLSSDPRITVHPTSEEIPITG